MNPPSASAFRRPCFSDVSTDKRLLLRILDLFTGAKTDRNERQQIAEIAGEVALGNEISRNEPLDVGTVELVARQSGQRLVS